MTARTRAVLVAALAVTALGILAAPASAATAVSVNGFTDPQGRLVSNAREHAELINQAGIRNARTDAFWQWVEPWAPLLGCRGAISGATSTASRACLAANDIRWLPVLAYSTFWASSVRDSYHAPPANDSDYIAYAEAVVRRYGRGGTFWAERPELNELAVTAWEVWNEPNLAHFWLPKPDAGRYARLFLGAREALKGVDPEAKVVMGGMHAYAFEYVESMYAAEPALRGAVDVFGYHPYGPDVEHVLKSVRKMRSTLDGLGEAQVPMWITELGWATQGEGAIPRAPDATRQGNCRWRRTCCCARTATSRWSPRTRGSPRSETPTTTTNGSASTAPTGRRPRRAARGTSRSPVTHVPAAARSASRCAAARQAGRGRSRSLSGWLCAAAAARASRAWSATAGGRSTACP